MLLNQSKGQEVITHPEWKTNKGETESQKHLCGVGHRNIKKIYLVMAHAINRLRCQRAKKVADLGIFFCF